MSKLELTDYEIEALKYTVDRAGGYLALSSAANKVLAFLEAQEAESGTPISDKAIDEMFESEGIAAVTPYVARTIERELAAVKA